MNSFLKRGKVLFADVATWLNHFLILNKLNKPLQTQVNNEIQASLSNVLESCDTIVNVVKNRGFYILPNVLSDDLLNKMRQEFRTIVDKTSDEFYGVDRHEGSVCVRVKPALTLSNAKN